MKMMTKNKKKKKDKNSKNKHKKILKMKSPNLKEKITCPKIQKYSI